MLFVRAGSKVKIRRVFILELDCNARNSWQLPLFCGPAFLLPVSHVMSIMQKVDNQWVSRPSIASKF